jgi:predicted membrane protein
METRIQFGPQFVLGILVIIVGVLFTLDNLDLIEARDLFRYWPALLIIYGVAKIVQSEHTPGRAWGVVVLVIGVLFMLEKLHILDFRVWDLWPVFLILLGMSMMWRSLDQQKRTAEVKTSGAAEPRPEIKDFVMMSGLKRSNTSSDFRGGEVTAIMGGVELDLRGASMKNSEAVLEIFAFWGGIEIRVPQDWNVNVQAIPLLGGIEDRTSRANPNSGKTLIIRGYAIMGGADISN